MEASVDVEKLAGDEASQRRGQENDRMRDLFGLAEAPDRNRLQCLLALPPVAEAQRDDALVLADVKLEDVTGLLEGSGPDLRFLRLRTPADATRASVKRLVRNAFRIAKA